MIAVISKDLFNSVNRNLNIHLIQTKFKVYVIFFPKQRLRDVTCLDGFPQSACAAFSSQKN